jgi:hypothetical protein
MQSGSCQVNAKARKIRPGLHYKYLFSSSQQVPKPHYIPNASSAKLMITGGLMLTAISLLLGEYHSFELSQISTQSLGAFI